MSKNILKTPIRLVSAHRITFLHIAVNPKYNFISIRRFISTTNCNNLQNIKKIRLQRTFHCESTKMNKERFEGTIDRFNGVTVDTTLESCSVEKLEDSLKAWIEEKKRCIWFKINIKDASWVPVLANHGFNFHHSREDYLMMFRWLPIGDSNLPPAAHTNLGVGGIVIDDNNRVLVVSERHFDYPHWKLPGGHVDRGEDIVDAAMREVKEETGIDTEFRSLVSLRHAHNVIFGNSDIYILVMLKPLHGNIVKCDREISQCRWMDLKEFLAHEHVHDSNKAMVQKALDYQEKGIRIFGEKKTLTFGNGKYTRELTNFCIEHW